MSAPIDIATIVKRVELLEQSIATILPIVSKLLASAGAAAATPPKLSAAAAPAAAAKKAKKGERKRDLPAKDPDAPKKELPEGVKAWNAFVTQTIEDMAQKGWEAFTDLSGKAWAGSKAAEDGTHVFSDTGDKPSRVKGGLVYASLLRARDDPEAAARAKARRETRDAQIASKSASGSESGSATGDGAVAEKPVSKRAQAAKERWAAMSEEERAERKAKMAAGRAAAKAGGAAEAGSAAEE
jgi:hypothetical protein